MRIVIVGAGHTGVQLARYLIREKHYVSLIESSEERARHASNRLDCLVLCDEGNSPAALEEAGIAKAEALVCVTNSDEVNMIICGIAASRYPLLLKIARVRNGDYVRLKQNAKNFSVMGIDCFVHPDVEAAKAVLRALSHGALGNILDFAGTSYKLASVYVAQGSAFDGLCIKDYHSVVKEDSLITLLEKESDSVREYILPSGSTVLRKGDRIHILAKESGIESIFRFAGLHEKSMRRIGIVGGGHIGAIVAEEVLRKRKVTIIERSYETCKELAARFPEALILNEDISDESFIAEERLGELDLIITATANQELNIIAATYLKSVGVKRAIAIVSGSGYEAIARQLGVDVAITMQSVTVDSILSNLMVKGMREVYHFGGGPLQIIEAQIGADSHAAEKAITEFRLSKGGLIMLVNRKEASFIPRGDYIFKAGDKIILIAKNGSEAELEKFFGSALAGKA